MLLEKIAHLEGVKNLLITILEIYLKIRTRLKVT